MSGKSVLRLAVAAYVCICIALALLIALAVWGAYREWAALRHTILQRQIERLRAHAERTVGRVERDLETAADWDQWEQSSWLAQHWETVVDGEEQMYAAIVNTDGRIVLHSDPAKVGRRLRRDWYERVLHNGGRGVLHTRSDALGTGDAALDIQLPIEVNGEEWGEYHVGLHLATFERKLGSHRREFVQRRAAGFGGVLLVALLAFGSLYYIATHSITLRRTIDDSSLERATEVSALAAGLAHEIRNPLHAIQLNLHTLQRAHQRGQPFSDDEMNSLLDESSREIDRIEHLMQQLVGFATPEIPRDETIDVTSELSAVVEFIGQELLRSNIKLETRFPEEPVLVNMDHGRLRQVMLNLLQNAQQAMVEGGRLRIALRRVRGNVEVAVSDSGPGISDTNRVRIFEPFFSTKENGTGLGLALVKRFVEEVSGEIRCEDSPGGGATFRVILPVAADQKVRGRKI